MRFGINGSSQAMSGGARAVLADMAAAEQEDFSSYWVAQIGLLDALGVITARGDTGSDMRLGTAVVSTWERHPHALATQALTAQALVGDRLVVGIGVNHRDRKSTRLNSSHGAIHQSCPARRSSDLFSSYWVAQIGLLDALGVITARGDTGSDMRLGTAVVSTWERHPHALATQALTAQALVGDRLVVGIGVNH